MVLENNLVMAKKVFRGYEDEFQGTINGYKKGSSISIRRPTAFTVRDGATATVQEVNEGKLTLTVDKQKGIDFSLTSQERTLSIDEYSERVIEPAMVSIANQVDRDLMALYYLVPNWVGTPGQTINSYSDFFVGPQRLNENAVPAMDRSAVLSPNDHGGLLGSQTALYISGAANDAYRDADLGRLAQVDTYMSQNVPSHTCGSRSGSPLVDLSITTSTISYDDVKDTWVQTIHIDTLGGATDTIAAGDVFTIGSASGNGVFAVNPVTKARLPHLKQFTVTTAATAVGSETDIIITPPIIWTGAQKTVDVVGVSDLDGLAINFVGTASTSYPQNMVFHKNAFALVMVPMEAPDGVPGVVRKSYKGLSVRMAPVWDGINDANFWRLDVLYGVCRLDGRLATRLSGT